MNAQSMHQDIPLIDIGHYDAVDNNDMLKEQIESACRDVGFMYICGHGTLEN
jgi:isopenicillin N synthase-like dioxygenase